MDGTAFVQVDGSIDAPLDSIAQPEHKATNGTSNRKARRQRAGRGESPAPAQRTNGPGSRAPKWTSNHVAPLYPRLKGAFDARVVGAGRAPISEPMSIVTNCRGRAERDARSHFGTIRVVPRTPSPLRGERRFLLPAASQRRHTWPTTNSYSPRRICRRTGTTSCRTCSHRRSAAAAAASRHAPAHRPG